MRETLPAPFWLTGYHRLRYWLLRHRPLSGKPQTYVLASWAFLRLLGVVYLLAFGSLWLQIDGLSGSQGIAPVAPGLEALQGKLGVERWWQLPTLFWFGASDILLHVACGVGVSSALLVVLGFVPVAGLLVLWLLYLSLATVCQPWLQFQWDSLLLEVGFLGIWLAPLTCRDRLCRAALPSPWTRWALRWLLIRLMLASGIVKLSSGDPTWQDLSALLFHFETQPLPTWVGWYAHHLPGLLLRALTLGMFAIELLVPWLILAPRRWRRLACGVLVGLQVIIALTGNYGFFNLLTVLLCLLLCDDAVWPRVWRARISREAFMPQPAQWPGWLVAPVVTLVCAVGFLHTLETLRWQIPWPAPLLQGVHWLAPLRIVNRYGLFAVMTTTRPELIIEGSHDGQTWREYPWRWKPGDTMQRPRFVAPSMPRLDWQMWFAALGTPQHNPWLRTFLERLLRGEPAVLGLLASNPFPDAPPRHIRAVRYHYQYTDVQTQRQTGAWWHRERQGLYMPVLSLQR